MTHYGQRLLALIKAQKPAVSVAADDEALLTGLDIDPDDV